MKIVDNPKYMVDIAFVYANKCKDCKAAYKLLEDILEEEFCAASTYNLFYLSDECIMFCMANEINDIPSCIIGSKHKFVGAKSFTKEAVKKAIADTKKPIEDES